MRLLPRRRGVKPPDELRCLTLDRMHLKLFMFGTGGRHIFLDFSTFLLLKWGHKTTSMSASAATEGHSSIAPSAGHLFFICRALSILSPGHPSPSKRLASRFDGRISSGIFTFELLAYHMFRLIAPDIVVL
jgi:hypothetical protein